MDKKKSMVYRDIVFFGPVSDSVSLRQQPDRPVPCKSGDRRL